MQARASMQETVVEQLEYEVGPIDKLSSDVREFALMER